MGRCNESAGQKLASHNVLQRVLLRGVNLAKSLTGEMIICFLSADHVQPPSCAKAIKALHFKIYVMLIAQNSGLRSRSESKIEIKEHP